MQTDVVTTDANLVNDPRKLVHAYHRSLESILEHGGAPIALSAAS